MCGLVITGLSIGSNVVQGLGVCGLIVYASALVQRWLSIGSAFCGVVQSLLANM